MADAGAPPTVPAALTPKLQSMGRKMVLQLYTVLRTIRIHDPTNNALLVATENLKDSINTLWAALGGIRLQFVDDLVYLNDVRLRIDSGMVDHMASLKAEFTSRGLGGLAFSRPVDTHALRDFLVLLARPVQNEDDVNELKVALNQMKELALELLGQRTLADHESREEIRIDRKTFALQTYAKTIVAARECLNALKSGKDPLGGKLHITRIVQDLVDIATERVNFLLKMCSIKKADKYPYNHAANTCVLSIVIGRALKIDRLRLVDLGMSAFLADMGYALLPPELTERTDVLTAEQKAEVREAAIRTLRSLIGKGRISDGVIRRVIVAYEHRYPYRDPAQPGRKELHIFSRIVAVADAYDALTTARPWREGYTPDAALRILGSEAGTRFDPLVVKVLVNLMGLYPLGSVVKLDSGETALVYHNSNDPKLFEKPWVKILRDATGKSVRRTLIRNLAEHVGQGGTIVSIEPPAAAADIDAAAKLLF